MNFTKFNSQIGLRRVRLLIFRGGICLNDKICRKYLNTDSMLLKLYTRRHVYLLYVKETEIKNATYICNIKYCVCLNI